MNFLKYFLPVLIMTLLWFGGVTTHAQQSQSSDQTDASATKSKSKSKKKTSAATDSPVSPVAPITPVAPSASTPASAASSNAAAPATPTAKYAPAATAQQQLRPQNGSGMVWVNANSRVYHKPGSHWYGKTKHGKYMTEADAQKAGYRPAEKE